jgi:predicted ATPase/class 3 adenylate cyclase
VTQARVEPLDAGRLSADDRAMRADLPTGAVTFLFTDVEGSTKLLRELGAEAYARELGEHRRIVRDSCAVEGGVEVDTQGDAFFFAFSSALGAVSAADAITEGLSPGPIRLRIGLHTGSPLVTDEGYVGDDVHLAARVAAAGHGGQVLISKASRELVDGLSLTDLGEHRLKDIEGAVSIYQLGDQTFPPLRTISNTNLPRPVASFVGRARERDQLLGLLQTGSRLVTLSGPGGSGKTRLALEVASELVTAFTAGVFWVGLAPLRDPALVTETIAQTLGAKDGLAEHVGERELLLLLDNFEQVAEAAPELAQLLAECPNLRCLVTSRELLRVNGEVEYPVAALAEPEAVELFCERSRLEPEETVAVLCRRLDHMPLAVELAAARTSVLTPLQILERLSQQLDLLKGGRDADPRQQTLRATIDWSHELLSPEEETLFRRLAVFRGGCTLEAAEEVAEADLDTLQSLLDKSLLRRTDDRFWMLETIRAYAWERLAESADESELRQRHARYFLNQSESEDPLLHDGLDMAVAYGHIDAEIDNLRAVLESARDTREDEILLRLTSSLEYYWSARGLAQEMQFWNTLALERGSTPARARMAVLNFSSSYAARELDWERADAFLAEWLRLAEEVGNEHEALRARNAAALHASDRGEFDDARRQFAEVGRRAAEVGDRMIVCFVTVNLAVLCGRAGDYEVGIEYATEAAKLFREFGDENGVAVSIATAAWCSLGLSDPASAASGFREALASLARHGACRTRQSFSNLSGFAAAVVALQMAETGAQLYGAADSIREELGVGFSDESEERTWDGGIAEARAALGEAAFSAAWERGKAMTPQDAVASALEVPLTRDGESGQANAVAVP